MLIPDDNIPTEEQCFEIGLDCTVKDVETLVNGVSFSFQAFVETDNQVRTATRSISLTVSDDRLNMLTLKPGVATV